MNTHETPALPQDQARRSAEDGPSTYWQAATFADTLLIEFEAARKRGDLDTLRDRFYVLAAYFRRTLSILHSAFQHRREGLAEAALSNLTVLQRALSAMREVAPNEAQSTLALESDVRQRVNRDLVHRILRDARGPLLPVTVARRFNELDLIADARPEAIEEALKTLVETGHAVEREGRYAPTHRAYIDSDVDRAELAMLFGPSLSRRFIGAGFEGLTHAISRQDGFRQLFREETGFGERTASVAVACAAALSTPLQALHAGGRWQHADLSSSGHPRAYQRLLHAVFRAHNYAAQVVEAPAGSGKTLVGMLCIEDWLRTLAPGQSILVMVPTVNYQQQWLGELCLNPAGLRMSPNLVYASTPRRLAGLRRRGEASPAVLVMTYVALAQAASGAGKGGFDRAAVERFLQGNNIRHIILDEVHKVAAELAGPAAGVIGVFRDWLRDGSLSSLIGFSGTLSAFRPQIASLGLELAYTLPVSDLIAQGWVAPFAEFGAPFNYSERERDVASLIDEYRAVLRRYLRRLGGERVRTWFTAIPLQQRVRIASALGMYAGRVDRESLIEERLMSWQAGDDVRLAEVQLISIVQVARGWSDQTMLAEASAAEEFETWAGELGAVRSRIRGLLPAGRLQELLGIQGFGSSLEATAFAGGPPSDARDALATTFAGAYLALRSWPRQTGEGRVSAVRSIIAAEQAERPVPGVIVFDNPAPLRMAGGALAPGFRGATGLFVQVLGDPSFVPMAALTSGIYLPDDRERPVHVAIADWIVRRVIGLEQRDALFMLISAGAGLAERPAAELRSVFERLYSEYVSALTERRATRVGDFERLLLQPLREAVRHSRLGRAATSILGWLSHDHQHLGNSVRTITSYAAIASAFRSARPVEAIQGDGQRRTIRVVQVGGGHRRQLLLDLTARIVDAEDLPIDLVIVSDWARTGWNVVSPNVLIDATATRNATAWQQLRGRAMRPAPPWSSVAQRLVQHLLHDDLNDAGEGETVSAREGGLHLSGLPRDEAELAARLFGDMRDGIDDSRSRDAMAVKVMLAINKVTHVYELVRAYGTASQVEYSRATRRWERSPAIAAKHSREEGVRPADGAYIAGPRHAPLIVDSDPRHDRPNAFKSRLAAELASADERIVQGWLRGATATEDVAGRASR